MKICIAHNEYIHRGGEDLCVDREIAVLREAGLHVIEFRPRNTSRFSAWRSAFLAPFGLDLEGQLERSLRTERPDLLHAHNLLPLLSPRIFQIAKQLGIKTVLTLHNYRPLCLNGLFMTPRLETCERCAKGGYFSGILRGCYRGSRLQSLGLAGHLNLQRHAYEAVDLFIAPSVFLRDKFVHYGFPSDKIIVQGHFLPHMPESPPCKPEPYALYLGRLSEEKGLRWLLSVFASPQAPMRLKVAGSGPLEALARLAHETKGSIDYVGYVTGDAKEDLLRRATAVVVSSDCYENFPLAVPEANAWGVPVVGADHGGLHDIIRVGVNGYLYPPRDPTAFWSSLQEAASGGHALRERTQNYARLHYAKEHFLSSRLALYEELMHGKSMRSGV